MKMYPGAKVLLSVRDLEKWYESAKHTIHTMVSVPEPPPTLQMANKLVWNQTFHGKFENRQHAMEVFEQHNEAVKKHVPPERLLVYEVKEGWKTLCEFLGVAIPKEKPFPHLNDTEDFRQRAQQSRAQRN